MWENLLLPRSLLAICRTVLQVASRAVSLQTQLFFWSLFVSLVNFPQAAQNVIQYTRGCSCSQFCPTAAFTKQRLQKTGFLQRATGGVHLSCVDSLDLARFSQHPKGCMYSVGFNKALEIPQQFISLAKANRKY